MAKTKIAKTGLAPGTLVHVGEKKMDFPATTVILFNEHEARKLEVNSVDALCEMDTSGYTVWINIDGIHDPHVIQRVGEHFGLDNLSLEDIMNTASRPKIEEFDNYVFLIVKELYIQDEQVKFEQISFVMKENLVISFQEIAGDSFEGVRARLKQETSKIRTRGTDYLLYCLIDSIVDNYFVALEQFELNVERLEDALFGNPTHLHFQQINLEKKKYGSIRKNLIPCREVVYAMHRSENVLFKKKTQFYIRDLYDHSLQISDHLEQIREHLTELKDVYLSNQNALMNNIMKTLTVVSTVFMACSLIAGIYGMNFKYMPELLWPDGYFYALILMGVISCGLVLFFRLRKWL